METVLELEQKLEYEYNLLIDIDTRYEYIIQLYYEIVKNLL